MKGLSGIAFAAMTKIRGERLNSGAVICCADTIPGMREKVVLRAVIEFVTRTQLATDVETHSSNTKSKRSPTNNPHCRAFFLGGRDFRQCAGISVVTIRIHHAEIIAQLC